MDKGNLKEYQILVNNQTIIVEDQNKCKAVTSCINVYKIKIPSDGSLDKLKLRIVGRGDMHNKELVVDTWSITASMRDLKYFLEYGAKHKLCKQKLRME